MKTRIQLVTAPIVFPLPAAFPDEGDCGSEIEFLGKVRAGEKGRSITGLFYECYEPMARNETERLLRELSTESSCLSAEFIHRLGWVPIHEVSICVRIRSIHRREGFQLLTQFLDRMKQDVPIWKVSPDSP